MNIDKVAVIGAGVMGSAIAGHFANAGIQVRLLDVVPANGKNRNGIAEAAIARMLCAEPPPLMRKSNAKLIRPGNIDDHLPTLAEVDWVIEAVIEDLAIKQALYRRLDAACGPDTAISSNTSTLPLRRLTEGLFAGFRQRFMITHFFNPPRYMRLLELVAGPDTRPDLFDAIERCADLRLGKNGVRCKDTPGFIANRIGIYWLQWGLLEAMRLNLSIEQADAAVSRPFGIPKTGVFGLFDLIGIDLVPHVLHSLADNLPADDPFHRINQVPPLLQKLIAEGYTGRKGKGGFYRLAEADGRRIKEALDLTTGTYRAARKSEAAATDSGEDALRAALSAPDDSGAYAWCVMSNTLGYAASLVPEIADDIVAVDAAFRDGFNWQWGPFELLDRVGLDWFRDRLIAEGRRIPPLLADRPRFYRIVDGQTQYTDVDGRLRPLPRRPGVLQLADIKQKSPSLLSNRSASLWDIGDGIACLELHGKLNILDLDTMDLIEQAIDKIQGGLGALVIYSDGPHFSAGADLNIVLDAIRQQAWDRVDQVIRRGQQAFRALKYAPFPVIGAPAGFALGGGCEILLHCDLIQAHAELVMGLVETGVGLIPGWGGCKEYLGRRLREPKRLGGPIPPILRAFETIGKARVSSSAFDAMDLGFLSPSDGITMNRSRLLADAKARAITLCADYRAPEPMVYPLPGPTAKYLLWMAAASLRLAGKISDYDAVIGRQLAVVLSGGGGDMTQPLTEDELLNLERRTFLQLVREPGTRARIEHMLNTGRALRN